MFDPQLQTFWCGNDAVYALAQIARQHGKRVAPRLQQTFELTDVSFALSDPSRPVADLINRKLNPAIAGAEALQLVGGFSDPGAMKTIAPVFAQFMDDDELKGAYGPRIGRFMPAVIERLKKDPRTRQAVVHVYDNHDLNDPPYKDVPCTQSFTFRIRRNQDGDEFLEMVARMRSSDVFLGLPYDLIQFSVLLLTVANILDLRPGRLVFQTSSLHLYARDVKAVDEFQHPMGTAADTVRLSGIRGDTWEKAAVRAKRLFYGDCFSPTPGETWLAKPVVQKLKGSK